VKAAPASAGHESLAYTDGQLELLKWIALASMFIDHFGRHLLGWGDATWVFASGRVAFPLFALVLGLNLARSGDRAGRAARSTGRLAIWCVISIVPSVLARGEPWIVNVLGTLGLGAALCWVIESRASTPLRVAACIAIGIASRHVEFGLAGVFLVGAIFFWKAEERPAAALLAVLLLLVIAWLNRTTGGMYGLLGTLACVPIAWTVRHLPARVPRLKRVFYFIYPIHLALIGVAKRML
jgi:hypothetical protein